MSVARHHAEWLSLMEVSGPFLSMPVLLRVFPQGLDELASEVNRNLRSAHEEWTLNQEARRYDPAMHNAWVRYVLETALEWLPEAMAEGPALSETLKAIVSEHGETLRPDMALVHPDTRRPHMLVQVLPADQGLEKPLKERRWKASPAARMIELLHATGVQLGLVTNGEHWMLVNAPRGETTGLASWYASLWGDEPVTLRAFSSLLGLRRFFGVADAHTLEAMLTESAADQQEVTDQLGYQVRRAVEVLVQRLNRVDKDRARTLLEGVEEKRLYEGALTVMMRLVFLFSAEERGMLLLGDRLYDQNYAVSTLRAQLRETADQHGEDVLERRRDAWTRLLATFRLVYGGSNHDRMRLPAYGGRLFDPDTYPFLEGRAPGTSWEDTPAQPLPIDNRTVLHLLEALQILQVKVPGGGPAESRRLSFRALDVEQIGHVYEGLLDHTAITAMEPVLGLTGTKNREPEIALSHLEDLVEEGADTLVEFLKSETGRSPSALRKALAQELDVFELGRFRAACENDEVLLKRVRPFAGLVRMDSFGYPVVITSGSVYVTAGADRRETGTHYTPKELTQTIVRYSLEPLVYRDMSNGVPTSPETLRTPREILELKICDMAMGSGSFLVRACEYLADRLVEAWESIEKREGRPIINLEGDVGSGTAHEIPVTPDPSERIRMARRAICDRCLYGVDINPMAVEIAKLSLWIFTLQKDIPFTFLDHVLRHGDSLLGVNIDQLRRWSLSRDEGTQLSWFHLPLQQALERALQLRNEIEATPVQVKDDADYKALLLSDAEEAMEIVKLGADLLIASELSPDVRTRDILRHDLLARFYLAVTAAEEHLRGSYTRQARNARTESMRELREEADQLLGNHTPFHWQLEFPEVFINPKNNDQPYGFIAFVGNPPFQGGQRITGKYGTAYRDYLVNQLAKGKRGSADLCAYFFLRPSDLIRTGGHVGLIATNTIAQGDTREVGLDQLVSNGWTIYRAVPSRKWPGNASLEVAHVWLLDGKWSGACTLDDQPVVGITPLLTVPTNVQGKPYQLAENSAKAFQGSIVLGMGFVLTPEQASYLIDRNPRNLDVLEQYLNGEDLNSRPDQSPSRWVINFHDWSLERAWSYPDCMEIVSQKVKPERDKDNRKARRERWWQFAERAPALYEAITGLTQVLVSCRVSKYVAHTLVPSGYVYDVGLNAFVLDHKTLVGLLDSTVYEIWVRQYASSLETRLRYTLTDCFETFPLPESTIETVHRGERYHKYRQTIMLSRQEGLTNTYNRFHNSQEMSTDIARLRELHVEMDYAVAAAYGWTDLDLGHGFHSTKQGVRYTISEPARRKVLDDLLALNHQRYAEEVAAGLHYKGKKNGAGGKGKGKGKKGQEAELAQRGLFE